MRFGRVRTPTFVTTVVGAGIAIVAIRGDSTIDTGALLAYAGNGIAAERAERALVVIHTQILDALVPIAGHFILAILAAPGTSVELCTIGVRVARDTTLGFLRVQILADAAGLAELHGAVVAVELTRAHVAEVRVEIAVLAHAGFIARIVGADVTVVAVNVGITIATTTATADILVLANASDAPVHRAAVLVVAIDVLRALRRQSHFLLRHIGRNVRFRRVDLRRSVRGVCVDAGHVADVVVARSIRRALKGRGDIVGTTNRHHHGDENQKVLHD